MALGRNGANRRERLRGVRTRPFGRTELGSRQHVDEPFTLCGAWGVDAPGPDGARSDSLMDSWFVAFAPPTHPTLLVAARLESVPYAGPETAATLVREVLLRARELTQR